jgi:Class II flagellar assembly regulator
MLKAALKRTALASTPMKIEGSRPVDTVRSARTQRSGAAGTFTPEMPQEAKAAPPAVASSSLAAIDTLIALQEVPDALAGKAKAARRGRDMLDLLEDIRDGLLLGGISRETLNRLLQLVNVKREEFVEPGLSALLDDIELRARVELAKFQFADANANG